MQSMTIGQIVSAVSGTLYGRDDVCVDAVCTDSRNITPGCLFVPWRGERFDGHAFVDSALEQGAVATLCADLPAQRREDKAYIHVADTRLALRALAKAYRDGFHIPFIQITGSVGKTTTKEMMAAVLSTGRKVHKTQQNFNNDIGTPLTLFDLAPEHEVAVIETGMNHFGEIRYLTEMVQPDIAVISNIGDAHMEFLGSREGILQAKCEIFEQLHSHGVALLNGDDPLLNTVTLPQKILRCGMSEHCDIRVTDVEDLGLDGIDCHIQTPKDCYALHINAPGQHMVYSVSLAVAAAELLGLSHQEIVDGVASYRGVDNRMNVIRLSQERIVLDDCYNASPQSMAAGLEVLVKSRGERRVAILGDMGELGALTAQAHYNIGTFAAMLGIDLVIAIGEKAKDLARGVEDGGGNVMHFPDKASAFPAIGQAFTPGTMVLVKASHFAMHFEEVVAYLKEMDSVHD